MTHTRFTRAALFLVALSSFLPTALAGPLSPPLGPVTSTAKPLSEIEPRIAVNATNTPGDANSSFIISQPGSYYLTSNLIGTNLKNGISITSANVTLDLNGFTLTGVAGSVRGILMIGGLNNIVIKNGSINGWGNGGLETSGGGFGGMIENISARLNTGNGITVNNAMIVRNCSAVGNTSIGIECFSNSIVVNCTAYQNGSHGISVTTGASVSYCSALQNTGSGFNSGFSGNSFAFCVANQNDAHGFNLGSDSQISNCVANSNGVDGIRFTTRNLVHANACANNGTAVTTGAGIHATSSDNRIEGNFCTGADRGIDADTSGNIILRNTCASNTINWEIAANNVVGPIIDRTAPASAAISGNSAPSSTGSSDPNANFTF